MLAPATSRPAPATLRNRLLGPQPSAGPTVWVAVLAVTAFAGLLRFWRLDRPDQLVFDETYYVKQGYTLLREGHELRWPTASPDETFTAGTPDSYLQQADFVVHPPVGKWVNALGMAVLGGDSPWGWRAGVALLGTLSVLVLALTARRLLASSLLGCTAGLLLAVDGHHLVHSRTALLDLSLSAFVLLAFFLLLLDRQWARRRLGDAVEGGADLGGLGPGLGWRPWRLAAGVALGLAVGTKWSGLYVLAAFGLLVLCWDAGARRAAGVRRWVLGGALRDGVPSFAALVGTAVVVYVASWAGWFRSEDAYGRQWAAENPSQRWGWVPDGLRSLWHYHAEMYAFHVSLDSPHPYQSSPWSWLVQGRPTSFFYEAPREGYSQAVTSLGNPVVWWGGTAALVVVVLAWALRRDWRAGAVLAGLAGAYLPWFAYQDRTIFTFYAVAFVPFLVLALTYALGLLLGPPRGQAAGLVRRRWGGAAAGAVVVAAVAALAYFWPVWTAEVIPYEAWRARMWWPSWI